MESPDLDGFRQHHHSLGGENPVVLTNAAILSTAADCSKA
jgi:hypothetical protein